MLSDKQIELLTKAAETIYQYCDKEKGFYGGISKSKSGERFEEWNSYSGSLAVLENRLHRDLSKEEITILALAVGYGPTPCLSPNMREQAMETLWSRKPETRKPGCYKKMMDVLTSFY